MVSTNKLHEGISGTLIASCLMYLLLHSLGLSTEGGIMSNLLYCLASRISCHGRPVESHP